jgi:hypothetical protein
MQPGAEQQTATSGDGAMREKDIQTSATEIETSAAEICATQTNVVGSPNPAEGDADDARSPDDACVGGNVTDCAASNTVALPVVADSTVDTLPKSTSVLEFKSLFYLGKKETPWSPQWDLTQRALTSGGVPKESATQIGKGNTMNGYRGDLPGVATHFKFYCWNQFVSVPLCLCVNADACCS